MRLCCSLFIEHKNTFHNKIEEKELNQLKKMTTVLQPITAIYKVVQTSQE